MITVRRIAELYEAKMNAVLDRVADPRELQITPTPSSGNCSPR